MKSRETKPAALFIDAEMASALADLPPFQFDAGGIAAVRELLPGAQAPPPDIERSDHTVADGVEVSVHRPRSATGPIPCVYWIHGGGYVIGNRHMDNEQLERWCRTNTCACVSIEYRLAPEFPFPTPLEDCHSGLAWTIDHADELGIDASRVGIAGLSAGGGLTASLAVMVREQDEFALSFQALGCPMLDDRQATPSSRTEGLAIWSRDSNRFGWSSYLGALYGTDDIPRLAVPARETDLGGLPPAYVSVGTADGFLDEDIEYAQRLNRAGVPVELHVYPGVPHGGSMFSTASVTQRMTRDLDDFVQRSLQP